MKYRVLAYNGFYWLSDLGTFDTFDEAQDALIDAHDKFCDPENEHDSEDYKASSEIFYSNSRIEEV